MFLSKNLFNSTLYYLRQNYFQNKTYLGYNQVNKVLTQSNQIDYRMLPAKVSKQIQMLVDNSFKSFFALIKKNIKCKLPKYLTKNGRQTVIYEKGAINHKNNILKLSKTNIIVHTKISYDKIKQIRIVPKNKFRINIEVLYEVECKLINRGMQYTYINFYWYKSKNLVILVFFLLTVLINFFNWLSVW